MIVTSTNSILPIAANVIIGTNVFSDIGSSYVDFFGGFALPAMRRRCRKCANVIVRGSDNDMKYIYLIYRKK